MRHPSQAICAAMLILAALNCRAVASGNPSARAGQLAGVYQLSDGKLIYIEPWPGGGGQFSYLDEAGEFRELFPISAASSSPDLSKDASAGSFEAGPGISLPSPVQFTIRFISASGGLAAGLILRRAAAPEVRARRVDAYRREEISFPSAAERLAGVLLSPPSNYPRPALILIGGTGPADRNSVLPISEFLLSHGVALLGYDKPGVGRSPGNWQTASLSELAGDAVSALRFLKSRKDIDPRRIGFLGVSQGGWVAPLAASQSAGAAFLISVSGPAISPAEVEQDRLKTELAARGFSEGEIRQALDLMQLRDAVTRGQQGLEVLQAALQKAQGAPWLQYAPLPSAANNMLLAHWRNLPLDYDPAPAIARLSLPVLALFGALDRNVVEPKNAERWQAALRQGNNQDYTIHIFPDGNHMLLESRTGSEEEIAALTRFVPAYQPLLLAWLRRHKIIAK